MSQGTRRNMAAVACAAGLALLCLGPATAPAKAGPGVPPQFFGISAFEPPTQSEFDRISRAGLGSFRLPIEWSVVQPEQDGAFSFAAYDGIVAGAAQAGLEVVPLLYGSPPYISGRPAQPPLKNTSQRQQYRRFVHAVVDRYGSGGSLWSENPATPLRPVRWWIAWNEPNLKIWWYPKPQPKRFVRLLKLTKRAATAADPSAKIVSGGIFRLPAARAGSSLESYMEGLYRTRGFKKAADAVAIHIFAPKPPQVLRTAQQARNIMNEAGDRRTPLWINELAWATGGKPPFFTTSHKGQAQRLGRTYRMLLKERRRLRLKRVFWLAFRDTPTGLSSWVQNTGLHDPAGNPKPAWFKLAGLAGGSP